MPTDRDEPLKPGAALVKLRWDKATDEQRAEQGRLMARARWGENRPPAKPKPKRRRPAKPQGG